MVLLLGDFEMHYRCSIDLVNLKFFNANADISSLKAHYDFDKYFGVSDPPGARGSAVDKPTLSLPPPSVLQRHQLATHLPYQDQLIVDDIKSELLLKNISSVLLVIV